MYLAAIVTPEGALEPPTVPYAVMMGSFEMCLSWANLQVLEGADVAIFGPDGDIVATAWVRESDAAE